MLGRGMHAGMSGDDPTRRDMLRRALSAGVFATAGAGVSALFGASSAGAETTTTTQLPATMILRALPADASPALIQAIEDGCCIHYTRDENHCTPNPCPRAEGIVIGTV